MHWLSVRYWVAAAVAAVVLAVAVAGLSGFGRSGGPTAAGPAVLGSPPHGEADAVCTRCVTDEKVGKTVEVEGEVVKQCPARGCWFRLKDDAGEVFVDLAPAKLFLTENRVGQHAKVIGRVVKQDGQLQLEAQHVEFTPAKKDAPSADK